MLVPLGPEELQPGRSLLEVTPPAYQFDNGIEEDLIEGWRA